MGTPAFRMVFISFSRFSQSSATPKIIAAVTKANAATEEIARMIAILRSSASPRA